MTLETSKRTHYRSWFTCASANLQTIRPGWWLGHPSENISQLGWLFPIYGRKKLMFQTTNQRPSPTFQFIHSIRGSRANLSIVYILLHAVEVACPKSQCRSWDHPHSFAAVIQYIFWKWPWSLISLSHRVTFSNSVTLLESSWEPSNHLQPPSHDVHPFEPLKILKKSPEKSPEMDACTASSPPSVLWSFALEILTSGCSNWMSMAILMWVNGWAPMINDAINDAYWWLMMAIILFELFRSTALFPCEEDIVGQSNNMVVSWNRVPPVIIHFNGIFHYKPSS